MVSFDDLIPQARRNSTAEQRYAAEEEAQRKANEEANILAQFGRGVKAQAGRFALGTAELANNLTGDRLIDPETLAMAQRGADVIDRGTGAAGFVGNIAGDPLTWALAGVGGAGIKGAKTTGEAAKAAAKASAITGGTSGLIQSTGDEKSNIGSNIANAATGSAIGFGLGGAAPYVGKAAKGAKQAIIPAIDNPETARLAQIAMSEGIPLSGSQVSGSRFAKSIASATKGIPFSGSKEFAESQISSFNKAALKKAGIDASNATPEVLTKAANDFSKKFTDLTQKTFINVDNSLLSKLADVESNVSKRLGKDATRPITSYIDDVLASGGVIDGVTYQNTRSQLGELAKATKDPLMSRAYKQMQQALDDAAFESLDSDGKKAWQEVRKQYGAFKTIQNAMNASGEAAAIGNISPSRLTIASKTGNRNYSMGAGELNDLARVGSAFLQDTIPNSGTPERLAAYGTIFGAPGLVAGGVPGALLSPVVGVGASRAFNAVNTYQPLIKKAISKGVQETTGSVLGQAAPQTAIRVPEAISQEERDSNRPVITQQPQAPIDFNDLIPQAPQSNAVQGDVMSRIAKVESGGNPNARNPNSSAAGLFQFTNDTWNASVQRWGKELGIKQGDKMNPQAQEAMARKLAESNAQYIQKNLGIQPDDGHIYLAHFMGAPAAVKLMRNYGKGASAAQMFPKEAKANQRIFFDANGRARTIEQVYDIVTSKVRVA